MATFAELKTQAAALLADPSNKTFSSTDLGYFINSGIAEVSRIAPQRFRENIEFVTDNMDYKIRGGQGNLVANPSFENGDEGLFETAYTTVNIGDGVLGGWEVSKDGTICRFSRSGNARGGTHIGTIKLEAADTTRYYYQHIPVNIDTTYYFSGYHWKGTSGGSANVIQVNTLDSNEDVVTVDVIRHDTTAGSPVFMSGSTTIPDDGTVAFLQISLIAYSAGNATDQFFAWDEISLIESGDGQGVAANSKDQIEVRRVEIWTFQDDNAPAHRIGQINRGQDNSEAGWDYWDGLLHIPYRVITALDPSTHYFRVWGYAPYDKLTYEGQTTDLSFEGEEAVLSYVKVEALSRLVLERDLYTQWQTRQGNTDVSPAALMNALSLAREDWRRKARSLLVLREGG